MALKAVEEEAGTSQEVADVVNHKEEVAFNLK